MPAAGVVSRDPCFMFPVDSLRAREGLAGFLRSGFVRALLAILLAMLLLAPYGPYGSYWPRGPTSISCPGSLASPLKTVEGGRRTEEGREGDQQ